MGDAIDDVLGCLEETQRRHEFFTQEGEFIPEDLCPFVTDPPARWTLANAGEDDSRVIEEGLLEEVGHAFWFSFDPVNLFFAMAGPPHFREWLNPNAYIKGTQPQVSVGSSRERSKTIDHACLSTCV